MKKKPACRLEESRKIFTGRIFSVTLDRVRFDDGKEVEMEVVRHAGAAAVVPVTEDGSVVLIRQYRYTVDSCIWEVPAGKLDPDDEDTRSCAIRELEEETGYRSNRLEKLGSILTTPGFSDERIDIFMARGLEKVGRHLEPDEYIDVSDMTIDQALIKIEKGEIEDSKTVIAIQLAARKLTGR